MTVSIVFARALSDELARRGIDPSAALASAGINDGRLTSLRSRLSFEETNALCKVAAQRTRDPALGLTLGASAPLHMLQAVGHLLLSERSLHTATETLRRFSSLFAEDLLWNVELDGELATVSFTLPSALEASSRCVADFTLALLARVSRQFMGLQVAPSSVRFRHATPPYAPLYPPVFDCPVHFGEPIDALSVPRVYFQRTQAHADEGSRRLYERTALSLLHEHREQLGVAHRVRAILRFETDFTNISPIRIAEQVGTGHRTLRRRLAEENTSLRKLVDEARCWSACQRLRLSDSSIKQIAADLGFSDPTAFHRAFRRWTGVPPGAYASLSEPREDAKSTE